MTADHSAYSTLGLRPGAGRAEVNEAYRRLMKEHHPDRPGGNSDRAADINRAYTLLRRRLGEPVRVPVPVPVRRRGTRWRYLAWLFIAAALSLSVALQSRDVRRALNRHGLLLALNAPFAGRPQDFSPVEADMSPFDTPLQPQIVDSAIADAVKFHSEHDAAGASAYSSDCQRSLRRERNVAWFDACAAFDEAMLTLGGDGAQASGPFDEPDVITRELAAAQMLSNDSLAADSRLHQIRSRVDLAILPMLDSAAGVRP